MSGHRTAARRIALVLAALAGCFSPQGSGGDSGSTSGSSGGMSSSGDVSSSGQPPTTDATTSDTSEGSSSGEPPACRAGAQECMDGVPNACVDGEWQELSPCEGDTPVCSTGMCRAIVYSGGMNTVRSNSNGEVRLVAHGFERSATSCADNVCITGGFRR